MEILFSPQLRDLNKVELHRHLDCSLRWSTVVELAPQIGFDLQGLSALQAREHFLVRTPMLDLESVLNKFLRTQKVLQSSEILERLAYEACEDAFNDGIRLLELRYAPTFIAEGHGALSFEKIHRSLVAGVEKAQMHFPMAVGLICIIQRTKSVQLAQQVVDFAIDHKDSFIALDLADAEVGFDPKKFAALFLKAKKEGLRITVHSGESPDPLSAQWVRDSIDILGAERIGHGVQIIHRPDIMNYVKEKGILLEVCPWSNHLTQAFAGHAAHPVRALFDNGISIAICSDDPGVFASTLTDEYEILHRVHQFTRHDFALCNQKAFEASFIPEAAKKAFRADFF